MKYKNTILFVCTGNSCRSQMAEGFMRKYINKDFHILSAGLKPSKVNPLAVRVMDEKHIDIFELFDGIQCTIRIFDED